MVKERSPRVWGPLLWIIMHHVTLNYDTKYKKEYREFFLKTIPNIIPCKKCVDNYLNHAKMIKINLNSKRELVTW